MFKSPDLRKYRADIDGMRAVAVLSVIIFHVNRSLLPGGFVGVDIFFVISGFLISGHIFQEIDEGRFSLAEFYRRRIKRIAPPLLTVVSVVLVAGLCLLRPGDIERLAESTVWSLLSLANVFFWLRQDTDYFAADNAQTPLLHLWSLGVEEQFYFLWPVILVAVYRPNRRSALAVCLVPVALASFAAGETYFREHSAFVYYMLPTRAGELMAGALAALLVGGASGERLSSNRGLAPLIATSGLAMVCGSLLMLSEDMVFPGWAALPPTLGTALLIIAGHLGSSWPSRLLAWAPMVGIGLISYSAYLWHWPLLAFYRYGYSRIGIVSGLLIVAITMLMAWLSYKFVERPARSSRGTPLQVFARQYVIPASAVGVVALFVMKTDGFALRPQAYVENLTALRAVSRPAFFHDSVCQRPRLEEADLANPACVLGEPSTGPVQAILWGDSNASHFIGMVGAFGKAAGFRFRNVETGSCPPLFVDLDEFVPPMRAVDCEHSWSVTRPSIVASPVVILAAAWTEYQRTSSRFLDEVFEMAKSLAEDKHLVIILGKVPFIPGYDRLCREKALLFPLLSCPALSVRPSDDVLQINEALQTFARQTDGVDFFDPGPFVCKGGLCSVFDANGDLTYYDRSHLTLEASWRIGGEIVQHHGVPETFTKIRGWGR